MILDVGDLRFADAAFVRGEAPYLARTAMAFDGDVEALAAQLRRESRGRVYRAFRILDARPVDEAGSAELLYLVEVRRRGQDVSFVEHAFFARTADGFVYAGGKVVSPPRRRADLDSWSIASYG